MKTCAVFSSVAIALVSHAVAQTVDTVLTNRLTEPYGVAVEANVHYITDSAAHRIVKFVPDSGAFSTLAGFSGRPGAVDAKGVYARFYNPRGILSVPALGGLVVSDYANHTLRLVKLDGTTTTLAGSPGVPGLDGAPVSALAAHFNFPSGLAADSAGNVYIADSKNNAIRKLDRAGLVSTVVSGLNQPNGVAVGDNGDLWIADSRDSTIKRLAASGTLQLIAGIPGQSGAADSIFANETLFNNPGALIWLGGANGLLVCDSGNHALRRVYADPEIQGYSVTTYAGVLTRPGFVDGPLLQAKFNSPVGITKDPTGGFLISDLGNNTIRRIQLSAPQPPVANPVIGWVDFQKDQFGELLSLLVPVTHAVFNNDVIIAVKAEAGTETYYTFGPTPPSSLEDTIPSPNRLTGNSPPAYRDGLHLSELAPSMIPPGPDVTIKVIGTADSRRPSAVVQARFQFKTANPTIIGDNAASFVITNITAGAQMWYTTDNSDPVVNGATSKPAPIGSLSLPRSHSVIVLKIRAFRTDYAPSEVITKTFNPEDYQANRISFGFENGEASSEFVASPGQTFYAPVTLSLLPGQKMYSLQFNLAVTNLDSSPSVAPGAVGFRSMLMQKVLLPSGQPAYAQIPPAMLLNDQTIPPGMESPLGFGDLRITNSALNLLAVGWLESFGQTNLYDTTLQDLITYSIAHDTLFLSSQQKVVVGGYMFVVPPTAKPGDLYKIQIGRPSATADGISQDNYIEAVTDGTLTATPTNLINSIKHVSIGERRYLVGDAAPFRWFNAGDFGDTNLLNNDVLQVFQSAIYGLNNPPFGTNKIPSGVHGYANRSDLFDAMDSSDGTVNGIFSGDDLTINEIKFGDGELNVDDVYVTFRRSLDPSLTWYARSWVNGTRQATPLPNTFRGAPAQLGQTLTYRTADLAALNFLPGDPGVTFKTDDMQVTAGATLQIPVRARVTGRYPLRVLMLGVSVEALDGSPAPARPVTFAPASALGDPTLTATEDPNRFGGAWLDNQVTGVAGETTVGYLSVQIPAEAIGGSAYRVHFDHVSASPNGLALFPKQVQDGLIVLKDRSTSTLGDGIPDSWRLRYLGSVTGAFAQGDVDADGDGIPNWAEYRAGTNPADAKSYFGLRADRGLAASNHRPLTLRWGSAPGKTYAVESASSLEGNTWKALTPGLPGTGQELQFTPEIIPGGAQFFRVRLSE